jgi:hypothetical protein
MGEIERDEFSKILRIDGGEDVYVYLSRFDPGDPDPERRTAELAFVTSNITVKLNGVPPDQLRGLAKMMREYANHLDEKI